MMFIKMDYHHYYRIVNHHNFKVLFLYLLHVTLNINQTYSWSLKNLLMTSSQATLANFENVWIGAQKGLDECARQFAYERWPCPDSILSKAYENNLPLNREIAFVQAIISAGIVHTVTQNCSAGGSNDCKCTTAYMTTGNGNDEHTTRSNFRWAGCTDNVELGYKMAIAYLDERESGRDLKAKIRLHNHQVGRMSVKETMVRKCKCHGISGSCAMQTCWTKVSNFHEVGNYLKRAYRKAVQIESNRPAEQQNILDTATWKLVYLQDSPNYCLPVSSGLNSTGTIGRECSMRKGQDVSIEERKSCKRLCKQCGYKIKKEKRVVSSLCNCKFEFCCEVQCKRCTKEEYSYYCSM